MGLFVSPYAPTSLREYFATGFEEYYIGDRNYLRKISPNLYTQISKLDDLQYPQYYLLILKPTTPVFLIIILLITFS